MAEQFYEHLSLGNVEAALALTAEQDELGSGLLERLSIAVDGFNAYFDYECHLEGSVVACYATVADDLYEPAGLESSVNVHYGIINGKLSVSYLDDGQQTSVCSYLSDFRVWSAQTHPELEEHWLFDPPTDSPLAIPCNAYPFTTSETAARFTSAVPEFIDQTERWQPLGTEARPTPPESPETGTDAPDLGSGWEQRLQADLPSWSLLAGGNETGFVVKGGDPLWSVNGQNWETANDGTTAHIHDFAANDDGFVGVINSMPLASVLFSPDGRTWETVNVGVSGWWLRVESGPDGFLLIGEEQTRFSPNGRDWLPAEIPEGCESLLAAPFGDGWTAVTQRGSEFLVLSSDDGANWNQIETQQPAPPLRLPCYWPGFDETAGQVALYSDGETLVLAGKGYGWWTSLDEGTTWTRTNDYAGRVEMTVSEFGFVGVSPRAVWFSTDGISWVEFPMDTTFRQVAAVRDTLVAIAEDGIYTWTRP